MRHILRTAYKCVFEICGKQRLLEIGIDAAWLDVFFIFAFSKLHPSEKY